MVDGDRAAPTAREHPEHPERRHATDAEARALASGLRLEILRMTLDQALTNKEIAERLGRHPASVLHHVRTLVETGFLAPQEVRRGTRGAREVPYRSTRKSWYLDDPPVSGAMLESFLADVARVPTDELQLTRLGLRLPEPEMDELRRRMFALLGEFAERASDPDAEPWSVFVAVHPDPARRGEPIKPEEPPLPE